MSLTTTSRPIVPPYVAAGRFEANSDQNNAGALWILSFLCIIYSTLFIIVRGLLRWKFLGLEDCLIVLGWVFMVIEVIALIVGLENGLGKSHVLLTAVQLSLSNTAVYLATILFIIATCFAKLSYVTFLMRLFNLRGARAVDGSKTLVQWLACLVGLVLVVAWGIGSIIGLSIDCQMSTFATAGAGNACPHMALRWDIIGGLDMFTEIFLGILVGIVVYPVQLKRSPKISIMGCFSTRLVCAFTSGLHVYYIHQFTKSIKTSVYDHSPKNDPGMRLVAVVALQQVQLYWSLASASFPMFTSTIKSMHCNMGLGFEFHTYAASNPRSTASNAISGSTLFSTDHELSIMKVSRKFSEAMSMRDDRRKQSQAPKRPSRIDVDLEGIGWHAGIPAIPGFGARRYESYPQRDPEPKWGTSEDGYSESRTTRQGSEASTRPSIGSNEHIIRKDMQYEVRYEMI